MSAPLRVGIATPGEAASDQFGCQKVAPKPLYASQFAITGWRRRAGSLPELENWIRAICGRATRQKFHKMIVCPDSLYWVQISAQAELHLPPDRRLVATGSALLRPPMIACTAVELGAARQLSRNRSERWRPILAQPELSRWRPGVALVTHAGRRQTHLAPR